MVRDIKYLSLDLELNLQEIIEVGVTIGSPFTPESDWIRRGWLVKPISNSPIEERITALTGISQELIDGEGVNHNTLCSELSSLIEFHKPFTNPVQWGLGDGPELLAEFKSMGLHFPYFGHRVIDVKHFFLYIEAANGRALSGSLRSAMNKNGLRFDGRAHRAVPDSYNTLRLFFHLLKRQQTLEQARLSLSFLK